MLFHIDGEGRICDAECRPLSPALVSSVPDFCLLSYETSPLDANDTPVDSVEPLTQVLGRDADGNLVDEATLCKPMGETGDGVCFSPLTLASLSVHEQKMISTLRAFVSIGVKDYHQNDPVVTKLPFKLTYGSNVKTDAKSMKENPRSESERGRASCVGIVSCGPYILPAMLTANPSTEKVCVCNVDGLDKASDQEMVDFSKRRIVSLDRGAFGDDGTGDADELCAMVVDSPTPAIPKEDDLFKTPSALGGGVTSPGKETWAPKKARVGLVFEDDIPPVGRRL